MNSNSNFTNPNSFNNYQLAPLACTTWVANTLCPHSGLRPLVEGKVISDFTNLGICFFSHRDNVPINNHLNHVSTRML